MMDTLYQDQGIRVEESSNHFLRFDFVSRNASTVRVFAASLVNGSASIKVDTMVTQGSPMYLRVERTGDDWTLWYSYDGAGWTQAVTFNHSMTVTAVGPYAGNFDSKGNAPAYTAIIDYFFNQANPVVPEDGSSGFTLDVTVTGSGTVIKNPDQAAYGCDDVVSLTANPTAGWEFSGWSGDLVSATNPDTITMDADKTVTAIFTQVSGTQHTLNVTTSGSGTVTLNPAGGVYDEGTVVQLTANPAAGWAFSG
jgi:uncharacterized repeat protein (TIGR02543 family)